MSTILDALKKSEQERKLTQVPTLSTMSAPVEPTRWPMYIIILLLFVLLGLFGYWFLQNNHPVGQSADEQGADSSLTDDYDRSLSDIVVNVVSYSEQSDRRFAMINGALYYEGDFIQSGVKVERITQDMVILNHRGQLVNKKP